MHTRFLTLIAVLFISSCVKTGNVVYEIAGKEVFEGAFIVCKSDVKWNGVSILIEGIEADNQEKTDKYTIGKLEYKDISIRQLDYIALNVENLFKQMCASTVALRNNKEALAEYVFKRDETALKLTEMLKDITAINEDDSLTEEEAIVKQNEVATPVIEEASNAVKT